jgi:hypothetical protein
MEENPISKEEMRLIALEEGLKSAVSLDQLRLKMLNYAVEWICELTELPVLEVRKEIASTRGKQVAKNLATINAVRSLIKDDYPTK